MYRLSSMQLKHLSHFAGASCRSVRGMRCRSLTTTLLSSHHHSTHHNSSSFPSVSQRLLDATLSDVDNLLSQPQSPPSPRVSTNAKPTNLYSHQSGHGKIVAISSNPSTSSSTISTHLTELSHSSPMRLVPSRRSHQHHLKHQHEVKHEAALVHLSSYGGGLVPGDVLHLDIDVRGKGATLCVLTQGGTRIYRPGKHFRQHVNYNYGGNNVNTSVYNRSTYTMYQANYANLQLMEQWNRVLHYSFYPIRQFRITNHRFKNVVCLDLNMHQLLQLIWDQSFLWTGTVLDVSIVLGWKRNDGHLTTWDRGLNYLSKINATSRLDIVRQY
jgi:hypothetical protein